MHGTAISPFRSGKRAPSTGTGGLAVLLRIALRDLRAGLRGFGVFLACLTLGVAAITGVGSLASSLSGGLAREGKTILGGDLAFSLIHREATPAETGALASQGALSSIATLRAMARAENGNATLIEIKAVDGSYPSVGALVTEPASSSAALFGLREGLYGAAVEPALLARLDLKVGDVVTIGTARVQIRASLVSEPDKVAAGIGFGPRLLMSQDALRASGLLQPGSLVRWTYRVGLPGPTDDKALDRATDAIKAAVPDAGWEIRSRTNASPQIARNLDRFTQFLALVGLTSLVVGGVGVANAVRGFVERKRITIAVLKSAGATGGRIFLICLIEVLILALAGIAAGLALGAALPFAVAYFFGALLPIPLEAAIHPSDLLLGATYGLATALAFALWPLGRAHDIPVSALFRDNVEPDRHWPRPAYLAAMLAAVAVLIVIAIGFAWDRRVAAIAVGATAASFLLLRLVASGVMAVAKRLPRPRRTELRLALANIHRPGSLTPSLVLSLGLGVALLVALALIDSNLNRELTRNLPAKAPSFFFIDIPNADAARFDAFLREQAPGATLDRVPMMRGRIVSLKGIRAEDYHASEQAAWVLEGDRGITYADKLPEGSRIVEGQWWEPGHRGSNLVSFDVELARALGLKVGDKVVVNVLGRNIETTIANLRQVEWRSLGINFVMVFSPNTFAGAPHTQLATVTFPNGAQPEQEFALVKAMGQSFPAVTSVRVKDALDAINALVGQLAAAIRGASAIVLAASMLVLGGALAAGHRARLYDAVVLKTLGATRWRILLAFCLEYGLLGLVTALFGAVAGTIAAFAITSYVMKLGFTFSAPAVAGASILAVVVTIILGLVGTWRILGEKAAPQLRNL